MLPFRTNVSTTDYVQSDAHDEKHHYLRKSEGEWRILRAGLVIRDPFEPQVPPEHAAQHRDPVGGAQGLGTAQPVAAAGVAFTGQGLHGPGGDVGRIDRGHGHVGEGGPDRVPGADRVDPLQRVGHERVGLQEGPVQPGFADRLLGQDVVARDRVVRVPAWDRARRLQDGPLHAAARALANSSDRLS